MMQKAPIIIYKLSWLRKSSLDQTTAILMYEKDFVRWREKMFKLEGTRCNVDQCLMEADVDSRFSRY